MFQGDYQDKNFGIYGTDTDVSSCFVSGTGQRAWWKIVLNETLVIQGFLLKGKEMDTRTQTNIFSDPLSEYLLANVCFRRELVIKNKRSPRV